MKVLKFGGTSVGTVESLTNVKEIVESCNEPVIVVVSALGGLTDKLIATARMAERGDESYIAEFEAMVDRHRMIIDSLVPETAKASLLPEIESLFKALARVYKGIYLLEELSRRSLDKVVSFGERLSSQIVSRIIRGAQLYDSLDFIRTLRRFGKHVLDAELTERLINQTFSNADFKVIVVPGFIARDSQGTLTNLGRGGSDYTAAILAASLGASTLEIWTDVDGFMTADPRIITGTKVIPCLSFIEAMELCNFGAKVIYPPTIYPVFHKNIPIYIKNTFNPSAPGTCIKDDKDRTDVRFIPKGVSSITDSCLITVGGTLRESVITSRVLNTLARIGVSVLLVSNVSDASATAFAIAASDAAIAVESLEKEFAAEIEIGDINAPGLMDHLATIALVGEGIKHSEDAHSAMSQTVIDRDIKVVAYSQGSPEANISLVVSADQRQHALQIIHDRFFN